MGEARLDLSRAEKNGMTEGLIIFFTAWAEGAAVSVFPGDVGSKMASTCAHLVDTVRYKAWEACKDVWSETGIVQI